MQGIFKVVLKQMIIQPNICPNTFLCHRVNCGGHTCPRRPLMHRPSGLGVVTGQCGYVAQLGPCSSSLTAQGQIFRQAQLILLQYHTGGRKEFSGSQPISSGCNTFMTLRGCHICPFHISLRQILELPGMIETMKFHFPFRIITLRSRFLGLSSIIRWQRAKLDFHICHGNGT